MKVLSGVHPHGTYTGDIRYNDSLCEFHNINDSEARGIVIIHQELALVPELSIAENIFLGNERARKGIINWNETIVETRKLLDRKSTRLNSSHVAISYAVFCLKKKTQPHS